MSFYGRFLREVACAGLTVGAGPTFWPLPALTIKMFKAPIPGVTLDATVVRSRAWPPPEVSK
jgi:hypothetical protein